jgi:ABC-2 type transport system permease protein
MIFITDILREESNMIKKMNNSDSFILSIPGFFKKIDDWLFSVNKDRRYEPFRVIVRKEITDHVTSWRFLILISIIILTCLGSVFSVMTGLKNAVKPSNMNNAFFFLQMFTLSDGTLPSFIVFISFLGPLLGISMGFDAINSEQNKGTLSRIMAQPIHRDYILNAKFTGSLIVIGLMIMALAFLVMGIGVLTLGVPPAPEEFIRIIIFVMLSVLYVAFWLNLSIFFSVKFRQPATSAMAGIATWLFLSVFYPLIVNLVTKSMTPPETASQIQVLHFEKFKIALMRFLPNQLFSDATTTLLVPTVRSLGPFTMEQVQGAIPGPLPLGQSILLVWPQVTGLIAVTILCFVLSYVSFMRREIRSR